AGVSRATPGRPDRARDAPTRGTKPLVAAVRSGAGGPTSRPDDAVHPAWRGRLCVAARWLSVVAKHPDPRRPDTTGPARYCGGGAPCTPPAMPRRDLHDAVRRCTWERPSSALSPSARLAVERYRAVGRRH